MATIVVMPQLGNSVESCLIMEWAVKPGDTVAVDQTLCSIETDKATIDVPSTDAGTVLQLLWEEGDEVPVKDPLLVLGEPGEHLDPDFLASHGVSASIEADPTPPSEAGGTDDNPVPTFATTASDGAVSPRARSLANESGLRIDALDEGSGPHGRVIARDVETHLAANPATSTARAQGTTGTGTGIGGRVSTADLAGAGEAPRPTQPTDAGAASSTPQVGTTTVTPLKGIRKVVAERMRASLAEAAQLSYTVSADATGLLALRRRLKGSQEWLGLRGVTIGDLVGYAVVKVLPRHPAHNATLADGVLTTYSDVHLGFAADTPRGLLVPVVHGAQSMGLGEFSRVSKELAAQAVGGTISPDALGGGTFTVTNLGSFGVETFTPIINRPQTAILGVAAITPHPVVTADGSVGVQQRIGLSLTADHQVIDGADAARFLRDLVAAIEDIDMTVLG